MGESLMDSIVIYAIDQASAKALTETYMNNMAAIARAIGAPKGTEEIYDKAHYRMKLKLPSGRALKIESCAYRDPKVTVMGILISLDKIRPKDGLDKELEIEARIRDIFWKAFASYPPSVRIYFRLINRKVQETLIRTRRPDSGAAPIRHFMAWIVAGLMAPLNAAIMIGWYYVVKLFLVWFSSLSTVYTIFGFIDDAISDEAGTGILGLVATVFLYASTGFMIYVSQRLHPTLKDRRYKVTGVIGILIAIGILVFYILKQDYLRATYGIEWMLVLYVLYAIGMVSIRLMIGKHSEFEL